MGLLGRISGTQPCNRQSVQPHYSLSSYIPLTRSAKPPRPIPDTHPQHPLPLHHPSLPHRPRPPRKDVQTPSVVARELRAAKLREQGRGRSAHVPRRARDVRDDALIANQVRRKGCRHLEEEAADVVALEEAGGGVGSLLLFGYGG